MDHNYFYLPFRPNFLETRTPNSRTDSGGCSQLNDWFLAAGLPFNGDQFKGCEGTQGVERVLVFYLEWTSHEKPEMRAWSLDMVTEDFPAAKEIGFLAFVRPNPGTKELLSKW